MRDVDAHRSPKHWIEKLKQFVIELCWTFYQTLKLIIINHHQQVKVNSMHYHQKERNTVINKCERHREGRGKK